LDLASGLPQVLSETTGSATTSYAYAGGPLQIDQSGTTYLYLADTVGSVPPDHGRQALSPDRIRPALQASEPGPAIAGSDRWPVRILPCLLPVAGLEPRTPTSRADRHYGFIVSLARCSTPGECLRVWRHGRSNAGERCQADRPANGVVKRLDRGTDNNDSAPSGRPHHTGVAVKFICISSLNQDRIGRLILLTEHRRRVAATAASTRAAN
jgi:hypothetical protein